MGRANKNQAYVSRSSEDERTSGRVDLGQIVLVSKWVLGTAIIQGVIFILGGTRLCLSANFAKRKKVAREE